MWKVTGYNTNVRIMYSKLNVKTNKNVSHKIVQYLKNSFLNLKIAKQRMYVFTRTYTNKTNIEWLTYKRRLKLTLGCNAEEEGGMRWVRLVETPLWWTILLSTISNYKMSQNDTNAVNGLLQSLLNYFW